MPTKYGHFPIDFQIILSTYKLDSQNKIKKTSLNAQYACDEASFFYVCFINVKNNALGMESNQSQPDWSRFPNSYMLLRCPIFKHY